MMKEEYDKIKERVMNGEISQHEAFKAQTKAYREANGGSLKGYLSSIHDYLGFRKPKRPKQ